MLQRETLGLIFAAASVEAVSDYNLKLWSMKKQPHNLMIGVSGYGVLIYLLTKIWEKDSLSVSNSLWNSFSLILNTGVGVTLLDESPSEKEWVSMLLSLSGMTLAGSEPASLT